VTNQYRSITRWRVQATAVEIFEILSQPLEYPRWWPSVYLDVRETGPGIVRLLTRGWLPYTLAWQAQENGAQPPNLLSVQATGDLFGRGVWSILPDPENTEFCDITFDWQVTAAKPLLKRLSFLLKPAFEANHRWAMEQGLRSLELELQRRRAGSVQEMNTIPAAPPPNRILRPERIAEAALAAAVLIGLSRNVFAESPRS
jgi:hypothetical protein